MECHSCGSLPHIDGCPLACVFLKDFRRNIGEANGIIISGFRLAVDGTWGFIFLHRMPRGTLIGLPFTKVVTDTEALWVWKAAIQLSELHKNEPKQFLRMCDKLDLQYAKYLQSHDEQSWCLLM